MLLSANPDEMVIGFEQDAPPRHRQQIFARQRTVLFLLHDRKFAANRLILSTLSLVQRGMSLNEGRVSTQE
jgi:hypothetical protein